MLFSLFDVGGLLSGTRQYCIGRRVSVALRRRSAVTQSLTAYKNSHEEAFRHQGDFFGRAF